MWRCCAGPASMSSMSAAVALKPLMPQTSLGLSPLPRDQRGQDREAELRCMRRQADEQSNIKRQLHPALCRMPSSELACQIAVASTEDLGCRQRGQRCPHLWAQQRRKLIGVTIAAHRGCDGVA